MDLRHPDEPDQALMRAALGDALAEWLAQSHLTQAGAAARLGTTQARISDIKRGKLQQFSLDLLVRLAARAGLGPVISFHHPPAA